MEKICPTCQREFPDEVGFCPHDGMKLRARRIESDDPMLGRVLDGRWVIERRIGEGGMGAVYLGHQTSVDRKIAIKTLRASLADADDFVDRFFREARVATTINHPHCVTIHDFGQTDDGTLYLAMEFLDGEPLSARIKAQDLTLEEILRIGMQMASALAAAHDAQIVHRDLKPDNIFLLNIPGGGTFVKVLDFGIAKVLGADTQMTRTGQVFGTPSYMSPEQCQGHAIDGRSDLYSLGCILYELVGGRPPFQGDTPMAVLMAHVVNEVPALIGLHCNGRPLDPRLERTIMCLLAKHPDDRPSSATEALALLESILTSLDSAVLAHKTSELTSTFANTISSDSVPTGAIKDVRKPSSPLGSTEEPFYDAGLGASQTRRRLVIALVLLLLSAGITFASFFSRNNSTAEDTTPSDLAAVEPAITPSDHEPPPDSPDEEVSPERDPATQVEVPPTRSDEQDSAPLDEDSPSPHEDPPDIERNTVPSRPAAPAPPRPRPAPEPTPAPEPAPAPDPAPLPDPEPEPAPEPETRDDPFDFFTDD